VLLHLNVAQDIAAERSRDAERAAAIKTLVADARRAAAVSAELPSGDVVIRLSRAGDGLALARLAELEGVALPHGSFVVAEEAGSLVAALPLDAPRPPLADPFRRTAHLIELLRLRAAQIRRAERPRGRWSRRPRLARA
jgi:hypothetical protein